MEPKCDGDAETRPDMGTATAPLPSIVPGTQSGVNIYGMNESLLERASREKAR